MAVLEARPWTPDVPSTAAVSIDDAERARRAFQFSADDHPIPHCFICGTRHDAQQVHAGALDDGRFASSWVVPEDGSFADDALDGLVHGVLDCTAHWYVSCRQPFRQAVTVQYAAAANGVVTAEQRYLEAYNRSENARASGCCAAPRACPSSRKRHC